MWQVNIGNSILYYPGSEDATIYDTNLNEECGLAGEFTFKVPPTNPLYSSLVNGALVTILKDKKEYWRGEISDIKIDFAKVAEVYCLEDLAWLGDEFLTPVLITNETYAQRFQSVIGSYNANRSADRQFTVGYINNRTSSALCRWATEYEWSILDSLRHLICGNDGYVRVRRVTSSGVVTRYIDIVSLDNYGVAASQPIEYGYNLLDYVKDSDYGNLTNVLTPYGDTLEDSEVYSGYSARLVGTTITNTDSVNAYGRHAKAVVFDGVTNVNSLNALASSYLSRYCQPQLTMEVSAVDLAEVGEADSFNIGDSIRVIAKPFAVDQRLYLTQIQRDIQNIDKNTITLSGHVARRSLTSQMLSVTDAIEDLPSESDILKAARRNALSMLLDETQGGYVVYEYDANNAYMVAINICNAKTINASTKRWRWAQNGFGYMHRDNTSQAWTGPTVAMTMDGSIVASFITSGTMYADRIKGGTLTLGGNNNENGKLSIKNAQGTEIGYWNKDGISVTNGSISAGTITSGTMSANRISGGSIDATNVSITNLNASNINSGTLNGNTVSVTNLSASNITGGSMSADRISGGSISGNNVSITNLNASNITGGSMSCDRLSGGTINGQSISGGSISGATITGGSININSGRFSVTNQGRVHLITQGASSADDYLVIEDPGGKQTYIGGEYIYSTGAAESVKIADLLNYYIAHR